MISDRQFLKHPSDLSSSLTREEFDWRIEELIICQYSRRISFDRISFVLTKVYYIDIENVNQRGLNN